MHFNKKESLISSFLNIGILLIWIVGSYGVLRSNIIFILGSFFAGTIVILFMISKIAMARKKILQKRVKLLENIKLIRYILLLDLFSMYGYIFYTRVIKVSDHLKQILDNGTIFLYEFIIGSKVIIIVSILLISMISVLSFED